MTQIRHEDFSADATCRAMGLGGLVDPAWTSAGEPAFRVLFQPSFTGPVCMTITSDGVAARLTVASLERLAWPGDQTRRYRAYRESATIDRAAAEAALAGLLAAYADSLLPDNCGYRDGMGIDASWCIAGVVTTPPWMHNSRKVARQFAAGLFTLADSVLTTDPIRTALARAGQYAGLKLAMPTEPSTMVTLIGDSCDKDGLMDALGHLEARRPGYPRDRMD